MNTKTLLLCGGGMNKSKRITKLVVETERTFIFRSRSRTRVLWCTGCEKEVEMAPLAEAARQAGLNELAVYKLVKERALHFAEGEGGRVLICLNSLSR